MTLPTTTSASPAKRSSGVARDRCVICGSEQLDEYRSAELERLEQVSFSYSFSPEHTKTFRVVRCTECTHLFCSPLPPRIAESYEEVVDEEYLKHHESRSLAAEAVLRIVALHTTGKRLLDVGCATGDLLTAGRKLGFETEGLELSSWSCAIARERGFTVHQETLADLAENAVERYDVITLIGVIEHFETPREEMANIAKLLRPGGIVVIWTGDSSSWLARVLGKRWWYWQGQHIQYFTHKSLDRTASSAGFEHIGTTAYPFAATHETVSNSLRRYPLRRLWSVMLAPIFALRPVVYLRLPGEMLFFGRKRS